MCTMKTNGTVVEDQGKIYHFSRISRLNNIHATHIAVAFVEGVCETWEIDNEHRTESVAQIAAYYNLMETQCRWIIVADNSGFRDPETPYEDQSPSLYLDK